jgi:hypothetical protein
LHFVSANFEFHSNFHFSFLFLFFFDTSLIFSQIYTANISPLLGSMCGEKQEKQEKKEKQEKQEK